MNNPINLTETIRLSAADTRVRVLCLVFGRPIRFIFNDTSEFARSPFCGLDLAGKVRRNFDVNESDIVERDLSGHYGEG